MLTKQEKEALILQFGGSKENSGATESQIALLTKDIEKLQSHFAENKKDNHSRRGLIRKVNLRRKLITYLKRKNPASAEALMEQLSTKKKQQEAK